jgi:hypothetical protein
LYTYILGLLRAQWIYPDPGPRHQELAIDPLQR